ncbi:hypothetical protein [Lacrimispora sp.]|uniref:hypothetical protein n=1 Tax=Lacrimispora sp. TaxID=2719234 RepID=UPI0028AA93EF|nr:hypothetical protein [Lacrimispora sp.]
MDIAILSLVIVIVIGLLFLSTGGKIAGVMISDYSISEEGDIMALKVGVASSKSCDEIYFYSGNGEYKLKLQKNSETNEWERVK